MRIRTIKPEWLDDERLSLASCEARVLSVSLILMADDDGRGRANPLVLAGRVFPGVADPRETSANALDELARARFIVLYEVDGQSYYAIRNWSRHQKVDKPRKSQLPAPPVDDDDNQSESLESRNVDERSENPREESPKPPRTFPVGPGPGPGPGSDRDPYPRARGGLGEVTESIRLGYLDRFKRHHAKLNPPRIAQGPGNELWREIASQLVDPADVDRLLDAFFADRWATEKGHKPRILLANIAELLDGKQARAGPRPPASADQFTPEEVDGFA